MQSRGGGCLGPRCARERHRALLGRRTELRPRAQISAPTRRNQHEPRDDTDADSPMVSPSPARSERYANPRRSRHRSMPAWTSRSPAAPDPGENCRDPASCAFRHTGRAGRSYIDNRKARSATGVRRYGIARPGLGSRLLPHMPGLRTRAIRPSRTHGAVSRARRHPSVAAPDPPWIAEARASDRQGITTPPHSVEPSDRPHRVLPTTWMGTPRGQRLSGLHTHGRRTPRATDVLRRLRVRRLRRVSSQESSSPSTTMRISDSSRTVR